MQCFWCHEVDNNSVSAGTKMQGTYGTGYHVDGETYFDPRSYSNGGTIVDGSGYGYEGGALRLSDREWQNMLECRVSALQLSYLRLSVRLIL